MTMPEYLTYFAAAFITTFLLCAVFVRWLRLGRVEQMRAGAAEARAAREKKEAELRALEKRVQEIRQARRAAKRAARRANADDFSN